MFTLDAPLTVQTAFGGGAGLPPVKDNRRFAIPGGKSNAPKAAKAPSAPAVAVPVRKAYPQARAAVDRRIALCEAHHARFIRWRAANIAKLQTWVMSQPGYDATKARCDAYDAKLRAAMRVRRNIAAQA